ncbi:TPA: hypothetical protein DEB29_02105 [Candidatus Wolfebacteria bacterium]|nr:hypothetical protein [Candidatus Wolfebacteria bacterium]
MENNQAESKPSCIQKQRALGALFLYDEIRHSCKRILQTKKSQQRFFVTLTYAKGEPKPFHKE